MLPTSRPVPFRRAASYAAVGMLVLAMPEAKAGQEEGLSACEAGDWRPPGTSRRGGHTTLEYQAIPADPCINDGDVGPINDGDVGPAGFCTTPSQHRGPVPTESIPGLGDRQTESPRRQRHERSKAATSRPQRKYQAGVRSIQPIPGTGIVSQGDM